MCAVLNEGRVLATRPGPVYDAYDVNSAVSMDKGHGHGICPLGSFPEAGVGTGRNAQD